MSVSFIIRDPIPIPIDTDGTMYRLFFLQVDVFKLVVVELASGHSRICEAVLLPFYRTQKDRDEGAVELRVGPVSVGAFIEVEPEVVDLCLGLPLDFYVIAFANCVEGV